MIVVSDTSPICYLLLIGEIDILPQLYGQVIIPTTVYQELCDPKSPFLIRNWLQQIPL
jgi:predicted nucleic acid-binding protein